VSPYIPEIDGVPRPSDVGRLTDRAEIEDVRRVYAEGAMSEQEATKWEHRWVPDEAEDYESAEELGAARDLEHWGYDPFRDFEA
jgi:hypothetical protein